MRKHLCITFNAPVVLTFVLISCVATFASMMTGGAIGRMFFMTYRAPLTSPLTWLRMFTHVFGHANWQHLLGNMSYLLLLGPMLEEKYSSKSLAIAVLITALITSVVNFVFFPNVALCGASGVVFAFIILSSFTGFRNGEIPMTFILVAALFIGQQVFDGIVVQDNISNLSHILGGIIGGVMGYQLNRR